MSRRSLATPKTRKSMLGLSSATAKLRGETKTPMEKKKLTFSAAKTGVLQSGSSRRLSKPGTPAGKDTRPLSTKPYQKMMRDTVIQFLNESGYPHPVSVKLLSAPTTKEFLRIFEHLYNFILPNFVLDPKKYAEEIPHLMKTLMFPFTISKSTMFGVGSMHAWPILLGVLHWLVELIQTTSEIAIEEILFPPALEAHPSVTYRKLFFDHSALAYTEFMKGKDEFEEENRWLEVGALKQAGCSEEDNERLHVEVKELESELAELEDEPDVLAEALKQKSELQDLIDQAEQSVNELGQEAVFLEQQQNMLAKQLKEEGITCAQIGDIARQEELKQNSAEVQSQVDRLDAEKERLEQQNDDREIRYSRMYSNFSIVANEYNDIVMRLSLNPMIQKHIGDQSLHLKINHSQNNLDDFRHRLKPLLVKLSNEVRDYECILSKEKIGKENELDKLVETLSTKENVLLVKHKEELAQLEKELENMIEFSEKQYTTCMEELRNKEELLDKKQKEATDKLEEEERQFALVKKECDIIHETQVQEQNAYVESLLKYGEQVLEHKKDCEDQIDMLNDYLRNETRNIAEEQENLSKLL